MILCFSKEKYFDNLLKLIFLLAAPLVLAVLLVQVGIIINVSNSLPHIFYLQSNRFDNLGTLDNTSDSSKQIAKTNNNNIVKEQIVLFCPVDNELFQLAKRQNIITGNNCAGDLGYLIKQIKGTAGDVVTINNDGVWINGKLLTNSKPLKLQNFSIAKLDNYQLKQNEVLLMSDYNPNSFDARYFGITNTAQIRSILIPLI